MVTGSPGYHNTKLSHEPTKGTGGDEGGVVGRDGKEVRVCKQNTLHVCVEFSNINK